jgi:hypothetical protein
LEDKDWRIYMAEAKIVVKLSSLEVSEAVIARARQVLADGANFGGVTVEFVHGDSGECRADVSFQYKKRLP